MPVYDEKYIKARVREFSGVINTNFLGDEIKRKCSLHLHSLYNYWFCLRMEKKNYPQVYLEECKYKSRKIKMTKFINTELESDSESELESDTELESKPELEPDSEW